MARIKERILFEEDANRTSEADRKRKIDDHKTLHEREQQKETRNLLESLEEARGLFGRILLPAFLEIAAMKGISKRDPYKQGLSFNSYGSTTIGEPRRSGYRVTEAGTIACGQMIWGLFKGSNSFGWLELVMGVSGEGMAGLSKDLHYVQYELKHNILTSSGLSSFESGVVDFVANNRGSRGNREPQFLSM